MPMTKPYLPIPVHADNRMSKILYVFAPHSKNPEWE